jgi:UDP-N-acetylglucosamine 2-epimerase (non-hydrolysing)
VSAPPVLLVAGARPNFMKVAPVLAALEARGVPVVLVHTGQHYDAAMSDVFFDELGIRPPDHHLEIGSASHAVQTARIMEAFEPVVLAEQPSWVVVAGDVNSTVACALVAAKLGVRVAHIEAGLRSSDWSMPEEVNRVVTDRLSDLLLAPSADGVDNLHAEGYLDERIRLVGNVMVDTLLANLGRAKASDALDRAGVAEGQYALLTLHRPSNVDDPATLAPLLHAVRDGAADLPVIYPVPCLTLRTTTERPITIDEGTNRLVGVDPVAIVAAAHQVLEHPPTARRPALWDGRAAERIADALLEA